MITSFVQYLLMAPSYINVLNVYAVSLYSTLSVRVLILEYSLQMYTMCPGEPRVTTRSARIWA